jgi:polysaccharide chain length determinant protein (PEP-CTERM system associated)
VSYDDTPQQPLQLDLGTVWRVARRRFWWFAIPAVLIAAAALAVAKILPPVYSAAGTIVIERPNVPPDLIDTTVTSYASERIEIIRQRFISTDNLRTLIEEYDLYPKQRRQMPMTAVAQTMRADLSVQMLEESRRGPSVAFDVAFHYPEPAKAKAIADEMVSYYLSQNARTRQEKAQETASFLRQQTGSLEQEVKELEARLADFRKENAGNLPDQLQVNQNRLEALQRQVRDARFRLESLQDERGALVARRDALPEPNSGPGGSLEAAQVASDLRQLRSQRATLAVDYTDRHPDIVRIDRSIEQLQQRLAQLPPPPSGVDAGRSAASIEAETAEIDQRIESVDLRISAVERERRALEGDIDETREQLKQTAAIADEYNALRRRYENAVSDYSTMRRKQLTADMGASLELNQKGERFTLVEAPSMPNAPDSPNRMMIAGGGAVFAMGLGLMALLAAEFFDTRLRSARKLESVTDMEPLVLIPDIRTSGDLRRTWAVRGALAGALAAAVAGGLWYVHTNVEPLDIVLIEAERTLTGLMLVAPTR